jgi:hypothetical protein
MEPLDDEGRTELARIRSLGEHPIESLPANGQTFSDSLLEKLTRQLDDLSQGRSSTPIENPRISALEAQVAELKAMFGAAVESKPSNGISLGAK